MSIYEYSTFFVVYSWKSVSEFQLMEYVYTKSIRELDQNYDSVPFLFGKSKVKLNFNHARTDCWIVHCFI